MTTLGGVESVALMIRDEEEYYQLKDLVGWFPIVAFYIKGTGHHGPHPTAVVGYLIEDENGNIVTDDFWGDTF